jgi:hypothetical protein
VMFITMSIFLVVCCVVTIIWNPIVNLSLIQL